MAEIKKIRYKCGCEKEMPPYPGGALSYISPARCEAHGELIDVNTFPIEKEIPLAAPPLNASYVDKVLFRHMNRQESITEVQVCPFCSLIGICNSMYGIMEMVPMLVMRASKGGYDA